MSEGERHENHWPDDEQPAPRPAPRVGLAGRVMRAIADAGVTIGMGQGVTGGKGGDTNRAMNNVMLIGEARHRIED